mmetsp:Transcript_2612/g.4846  ORF Transcript_2612/g.4846 Transcript_2612/m.4846 type:complete len:203 (+) Transcript_2612:1028-1636(+)
MIRLCRSLSIIRKSSNSMICLCSRQSIIRNSRSRIISRGGIVGRSRIICSNRSRIIDRSRFIDRSRSRNRSSNNRNGSFTTCLLLPVPQPRRRRILHQLPFPLQLPLLHRSHIPHLLPLLSHPRQTLHFRNIDHLHPGGFSSPSDSAIAAAGRAQYGAGGAWHPSLERCSGHDSRRGTASPSSCCGETGETSRSSGPACCCG